MKALQSRWGNAGGRWPVTESSDTQVNDYPMELMGEVQQQSYSVERVQGVCFVVCPRQQERQRSLGFLFTI